MGISLMSGRSGTKDYASLRDVESCFYTNSVVCDINYKDGINLIFGLHKML